MVPQFVYVEPGQFFMGSPEHENGRFPDELLHSVTISEGFWIQEDTVTVGEWRNFIESTNYTTEAEKNGESWCLVPKHNWRFQRILPRYDWKIRNNIYWDKPGFDQTEKHPVTCVTWNDAQAFIEWKSNLENKTFRLPTEAEWEYTCRAGADTAFWYGNNEVYHRFNCSQGLRGIYKRYKILSFLHKNQRTAPTRSHMPNSWGIYNMHGNVWEWCLDRCDEKNDIPKSYVNGIENPVSTIGESRALRGGSWAYPAIFARSAYRRVLKPDFAASGIGFRCAITKH